MCSDPYGTVLEYRTLFPSNYLIVGLHTLRRTSLLLFAPKATNFCKQHASNSIQGGSLSTT